MALTFPQNPTNGQIYGQYIFESTSGTWKIYDNEYGLIDVLAIKANLSGGNTFSGNQIMSSGYHVQANYPAFHAKGGLTGNANYAAGATVLFDTIRYNIGNCYNTSTSRFTAPIAGVYVFWFEAFSTTSAEKRVGLRVNGNAGDPRFGQGQAGNAVAFQQCVTVQLSAGDYVSVMSTYDNTYIYRYDGHSEFGGALLYGV